MPNKNSTEDHTGDADYSAPRSPPDLSDETRNSPKSIVLRDGFHPSGSGHW